jgi:uncharacterized protein YdbL (DUF1318 family)
MSVVFARNWKHVWFAVLVLVLAMQVSPLAATENITIQRQLSERLNAIDSVKLSGRVGENYTGYLEARAELSPGEYKIVAEENGDRRKIYAIVAIKTNTSSKTVGRARGKQIAERSRAGIWLQNESGDWYQK